MKKQLLMFMLCLISCISVLYMYSKGNIVSILNAQSAPAFQLPKGAKVVLGKYNNKEIVWDIGNNDGNYVLMSSKPLVDSIQRYSPLIGCEQVLFAHGGQYVYNCPNTLLDDEISKISLTPKENNLIIRNFYIPTYSEIKTGGTLGLTLFDRAYKTDIRYYLDERGNFPVSMEGGWANDIRVFVQGAQNYTPIVPDLISSDTGMPVNKADLVDGVLDYYDVGGQITIDEAALRPFATISFTKIKFAANVSYTDGSWHNYRIDTANLNKNNELNPNKLRIQSSLTASLLDVKRNRQSTQKVIKNSSVNLSVNANTGTSTRISVILYDDTGTDIQYYKLGSSTLNGTNDYTVDLTGIPVGKYLVAVINEEYDASSQLPVESSSISDLLPLEIVEPHKLTYTKQPQSGASSGKDYEVNKNVNAGQIVGKIAANPQGVMPLTYSVDSNGDNTYQNFEIDGLSSDTSSSTSLNVKIKSNAPDLVNGGLKAGAYKFCVSAVDANGDPTTATTDSKVCTSFNVAKTNLTVAFDDPNQTKKSITQATAGWSETATANPSAGTKVVYTKSGGSIGLINIDPDTGAISHTGGTAYGKVTIKATADDDPSSGYDNYNPADTTKEIVIYREVDGNVTPDSNSSSTTVPTFTTSDANIKPNGVIGKIIGTLGTPDNATSGTTTYKYGIKNIDDYN